MPEMQDAAIQMAETLQTAHVNRNPNIDRDLAPGTAADKKEAVSFEQSPDVDTLSDIGEDEIPVSILRPPPRRPQMPPLPDLRFEQSYLASIQDAKGWQIVTYITIRDQVWMKGHLLCHLRDVLTHVCNRSSCHLYRVSPGL